jgi:hypothetical protein
MEKGGMSVYAGAESGSGTCERCRPTACRQYTFHSSEYCNEGDSLLSICVTLFVL